MRHLTLVRSTALLAFVTLFSACGSDSTGPNYDDSFTADDAEGPAIGIALGSQQIMENLHWGTPDVGIFAPPVAASMGLTAAPLRRHTSRLPIPTARTSVGAYLSALQASAPGCAVSGHGSDGDAFTPYDGNENGVGDDFFVRIDCAGIDSISPGVTSTWKEWGELRIKERTGVLWGWDASSAQGGSDKQSDGLDRDEGAEEYGEHMVITADRAEYSQSYHYAENGLDGVDPYDDAQGGEITMVFTPAGDPIVFHELYPEGTASVSGRFWQTDINGPDLNWVIHTADPLVWSAECAIDIDQPFVDGTVLALLNGNSEKGFSVSAGVCGDGWSFDLFGDSVATAPKFQLRGFTLPPVASLDRR